MANGMVQEYLDSDFFELEINQVVVFSLFHTAQIHTFPNRISVL